MRKTMLFLVACTPILATFACRPAGTATPKPDAIDTAVAQTVQVRLTSEAPTRTSPSEPTDTMQPEPTDTSLPEPADTPEPTDTPLPEPTDTLVPTTAPPTDTPVPTAAPPTDTPVPTAVAAIDTPSPVPTTAQPPTETPTPQPTAPPTPTCPLAVAPQFSSRLAARPDVLLRLGCPTGLARETWAAEERFQFGGMLWQQDTDVIHIVYGNRTYQWVPDQWEEGDPEYPCPEQGPAPAGLVMPKRGFGWHWCNTPGVRAGLGWALEDEQGYQTVWQTFEKGHLLHNRQGVAFVFYDDGTWETIG